MASKRGFFSLLGAIFGRSRTTSEQDGKVLVLDTPVPKLPRGPRYPQRYNSVEKSVAKYQIGQVVRHRVFPFRGIVFDVDPEFANTDEWYESIPEEVRPRKDQPYYHLFAENERTHYVAYVSEQNLLPDTSKDPLTHPDIPEMFETTDNGTYELKKWAAN